MTTGECGRFPPSTACQIAVLCFTNRLHHMSNDKLVKKVYRVLMELNDQGFTTWATDALKLVNDLSLDLNDVQKNFAINCKHAVQSNYIATWFANLHAIQSNPILRTYRTIKYEYSMEPYLYHVKKSQYRLSIAKLRCSSHLLEIERGRHTSPKTPVANRKCLICNEIEDEKHFVLDCIINKAEREWFFGKVSSIYGEVTCLDAEHKFHFIMTSNDPRCLKWLGIFLHNSFMTRNQHAHFKK